MKKKEKVLFRDDELNALMDSYIKKLKKLKKVSSNTGVKTDADINTHQRVDMGIQFTTQQMVTLLEQNKDKLLNNVIPV